MKYIIVSKNNNIGSINDDSYHLSNYFELGWELTTTSLYVKKLLNENIINSDDCIVTTTERKFLYNKVFNNVIDYQDFLKISNKSQVIDLVNEVINHKLFFETQNSPTKYNYHNILNLIQDVNFCDLNTFNIDCDFICLSIRKRNHDNYRNIDDSFAIELIDALKKQFKKIFLVGFGSEIFADNITTFYVNLQEFASLTQHKNCKATINSGGTSFIPALLSKAQKMILLDTNANFSDEYPGNPLLFGKCIRFSNTNYIIIPKNDITIKNIISKL